jgi:hypothetical protein
MDRNRIHDCGEIWAALVHALVLRVVAISLRVSQANTLARTPVTYVDDVRYCRSCHFIAGMRADSRDVIGGATDAVTGATSAARAAAFA